MAGPAHSLVPGAMSKTNRRILADNYVRITRSMMPHELMPHLIQNRLLTIQEEDMVCAEKGIYAQNRKILSLLDLKPDEMFPRFIRSLRDSHQGHVADFLDRKSDSDLLSLMSLLQQLPYGPHEDNIEDIKKNLSDLNEEQVNIVCTAPISWIEKAAKGSDAHICKECPVTKAWNNGDIGAVKAMVNCGLNPSSEVDVNKQTLLHWAAVAGNCDMCTFLCSKGANIFAKDKDGKTPVDLARDSETSACLQMECCNDGKKSATNNDDTSSIDQMQEKPVDSHHGARSKQRRDPVLGIEKTTADMSLEHDTSGPGARSNQQSDPVADIKTTDTDMIPKASEHTNPADCIIFANDTHTKSKKKNPNYIKIITKYIGLDWEKLLRELNFAGDEIEQDALIQEIKVAYPGQLSEQAHQCFVYYRKRAGSGASYDRVINALIASGREDIVEKLNEPII